MHNISRLLCILITTILIITKDNSISFVNLSQITTIINYWLKRFFTHEEPQKHIILT
jgi:hypothetical protein